MKKLVVVFLCIALFFTTISFEGLSRTDTKNDLVMQEQGSHEGICRIFMSCYVVSSGDHASQFKIIYLKPFNGDFAVVCAWKIFYEDSTTTIYNRKNGDVLWDYEGQHNLCLIGFRGFYTCCDTHTICGNAFLVRPSFFPRP